MKTNAEPAIQIFDRGRQLWTTSLDVAEKFGKRHADVLRAIDNLECSKEFNQRNFALVEHLDAKGEGRPMYELTRDGFTMLAMGFTGRKAIAWKERYIEAFNAMERSLLDLAGEELRKASRAERRAQVEWQHARAEGKSGRRELAVAIRRLQELAGRQQPKNNSHVYYFQFTRMIFRELFNIGHAPKRVREELPASALRKLQMVEAQAAEWINECVDQGVDYHEPYSMVKERVRALVSVIGAVDIGLPESSDNAILSDGERNSLSRQFLGDNGRTPSDKGGGNSECG
jgi:Rha family phage regulatory protein